MNKLDVVKHSHVDFSLRSDRKVSNSVKNSPFGILTWDMIRLILSKLEPEESVHLLHHKIFHHTMKEKLKNLKPSKKKAVELAAEMGYLSLLKWLKKCYQCPMDDVSYVAANKGQLEVLKWASLHDFDLSSRFKALPKAMRREIVCIREWEQEESVKILESLFAGAALGGHLDILKYAHEQGCPWDAKTCMYAASLGHLDILIYAHQNHCPWDAMTCQEAEMRGHNHILEWARKNGCPDNSRNWLL